MVSKFCSKHRTPYQGRCPDCYTADNQRRHRKQQALGRTSGSWQRLKRAAKEAVGYRCEACGRHEEPHARGWLSVHLRDEYRGMSHADPSLSLEHVLVLCLGCHGQHHAPEGGSYGKEPSGTTG